MPRQLRALKLDVKSVTEAGEFEGYASTRDRDQGGDIMAEGAFKRTIDLNGGVFPILWFHDPAQPVGLGTVKEDGHGLFTKGRLNLEKQIGRDTHSDMKFGVVDRMSIGFLTVQSEYDQEREARVISEVRLLEYSLITKNFAMNEQALITNVKSLSDPVVRSFVDAWAVISELKTEVKEGRVLSARNKQHVESAIEAMQKATESLSSLLAAARQAEDSGKAHSSPRESKEATTQRISSDLVHLIRQNAAELGSLCA